jgi:hypothetical protein
LTVAAISPDKSIPTIAQLTALGCSEVLVRVSSYSPEPGNRGPDSSMKALEWQAIVKHVNAANPWAVAVRKDPDEAERDARRLFVEMNSKPHKVAALAAQRNPKPAAPKPPAKPVNGSLDDDLDDLV